MFLVYRQLPKGTRVATCTGSASRIPDQTGTVVLNRFLPDTPSAVHGEFRGTINRGDVLIRF